MAFGVFDESDMSGRVNPLINVDAASDTSRAAWNGEMRNLSVRRDAPGLTDMAFTNDRVSDQSVPSPGYPAAAPYAGANRFYPPAVDHASNYYNQRFGTAESVVSQIGQMIKSAAKA